MRSLLGVGVVVVVVVSRGVGMILEVWFGNKGTGGGGVGYWDGAFEEVVGCGFEIRGMVLMVRIG